MRLDVEARGNNLILPNLPMVGPVSVQLQLSDGTSSSCWGATYSSQSRNTLTEFQAVSDQ